MKGTRRGLFRLWLVGTIVWAALIFLASSRDTRPEAATLTVEAAFVPPAIVLVVGAMLIWAVSGFSDRR
jgi:hypothetical protein